VVHECLHGWTPPGATSDLNSAQLNVPAHPADALGRNVTLRLVLCQRSQQARYDAEIWMPKQSMRVLAIRPDGCRPQKCSSKECRLCLARSSGPPGCWSPRRAKSTAGVCSAGRHYIRSVAGSALSRRVPEDRSVSLLALCDLRGLVTDLECGACQLVFRPHHLFRITVQVPPGSQV
jgi:hypothetical protein